MYAELINKYRATNKLKIVEVNAKDFSEIDTKIFSTQKFFCEN